MYKKDNFIDEFLDLKIMELFSFPSVEFEAKDLDSLCTEYFLLLLILMAVKVYQLKLAKICFNNY